MIGKKVNVTVEFCKRLMCFLTAQQKYNALQFSKGTSKKMLKWWTGLWQGMRTSDEKSSPFSEELEEVLDFFSLEDILFRQHWWAGGYIERFWLTVKKRRSHSLLNSHSLTNPKFEGDSFHFEKHAVSSRQRWLEQSQPNGDTCRCCCPHWIKHDSALINPNTAKQSPNSNAFGSFPPILLSINSHSLLNHSISFILMILYLLFRWFVDFDTHEEGLLFFMIGGEGEKLMMRLPTSVTFIECRACFKFWAHNEI
jgi:hypothetical protein